MQVDFNISDINQVKQINWVDVDNDGDQDLFFTRFGFSPKMYINTGNMNFSDASFGAGFFTSLMGFGSSWGDINNDGLVDLYFTANQGSNKLYLNQGDFQFEDITSFAGVTDALGWTTGVTMVDINNDGYLDIYVNKSGSLDDPALRKNLLYINQQDNTFKERAERYGLDDIRFGSQAYFFDYDHDGDLDMYQVNHLDFDLGFKVALLHR